MKGTPRLAGFTGLWKLVHPQVRGMHRQIPGKPQRICSQRLSSYWQSITDRVERAVESKLPFPSSVAEVIHCSGPRATPEGFDGIRTQASWEIQKKQMLAGYFRSQGGEESLLKTAGEDSAVWGKLRQGTISGTTRQKQTGPWSYRAGTQDLHRPFGILHERETFI